MTPCPRFSEGAACGRSREDRAKTLTDVRQILQTLGFPWHIVTLEEVRGFVPEAAGCTGGPCLLGEVSRRPPPWPLCSRHVVGGPGPYALALPWQVFALPPSVLRCSAQDPVGTMGTYKVAVDSFLQQQRTLAAEGLRGSPSSAQGEEQPSQPCTQDSQDPVGPPPAAQTEALSQLFNSVKTLTAKEELLQTLR